MESPCVGAELEYFHEPPCTESAGYAMRKAQLEKQSALSISILEIKKKGTFFAIHAHGLIGCGTDAARTKRDTALLRGTVQFATRIHPLIGRHN